MNRTIILAAALLVAGAPVAVRAQTTTETTPAVRPAPNQALELYSERLGLTEDQKTKLKPIIMDRREQMKDLRADTSVQGRDKMKRMKEVMADSDKRIKAVLTPDQQKKYDALEAEQREKMKEQRQQRGGNN